MEVSLSEDFLSDLSGLNSSLRRKMQSDSSYSSEARRKNYKGWGHPGLAGPPPEIFTLHFDFCRYELPHAMHYRRRTVSGIQGR